MLWIPWSCTRSSAAGTPGPAAGRPDGLGSIRRGRLRHPADLGILRRAPQAASWKRVKPAAKEAFISFPVFDCRRPAMTPAIGDEMRFLFFV